MQKKNLNINLLGFTASCPSNCCHFPLSSDTEITQVINSSCWLGAFIYPCADSLDTFALRACVSRLCNRCWALWSQLVWVHIPGLLLICCVTSVKLFHHKTGPTLDEMGQQVKASGSLSGCQLSVLISCHNYDTEKETSLVAGVSVSFFFKK